MSLLYFNFVLFVIGDCQVGCKRQYFERVTRLLYLMKIKLHFNRMMIFITPIPNVDFLSFFFDITS